MPSISGPRGEVRAKRHDGTPVVISVYRKRSSTYLSLDGHSTLFSRQSSQGQRLRYGSDARFSRDGCRISSLLTRLAWLPHLKDFGHPSIHYRGPVIGAVRVHDVVLALSEGFVEFGRFAYVE